MALNLAKRPFVDTRPVNALTAFLVMLVLVLSAVSWRTFRAYLQGSRGTQVAITALKAEVASEESVRREHEAALARFDLTELGISAEDANEIARRRSFSWTRFLTRLEGTLPPAVRVVGISLAGMGGKSGEKSGARSATSEKPGNAGGMPLDLILVARDPLAMPNLIRAFYGSPWFDTPEPRADEGPEKGSPEGRRITLGVSYYDTGRVTPAPASALARAPASAPEAAQAARKKSPVSRPATGRNAR